MPHGTRNKQISPLKRTKTSDIQQKLNVACFVQSCLADADFVLFSNYCLIGTRRRALFFFISAVRRLPVRLPCVKGAIVGAAPPRNRKSALSQVGQGAFSNENRERKEEKSMSIGVREGIFEKISCCWCFPLG